MKLILAVAILLATISTAEAEPELGDDSNNPNATTHLMSLYACEEAVIRANFFLQNDEKSIWPLITNGCAKQIHVAKEACRRVSDDDCGTNIDNSLSSHYTDVVIDIMKENR